MPPLSRRRFLALTGAGLAAWLASGPARAAPAALPGTERPLLSRADLPRLKKLDRAGVFAALGSFDGQGLPDEAFALAAAGLMDPKRVPGLAEALKARSTAGVLDAVARTCRAAAAAAKSPEAAPTAVSAPVRAIADDALTHRFTFYGESYQLPPRIDWDANPGTAHWGHDLNRFTYLAALTTTYLATGDERYSRGAVQLILDWIAANDAVKCFAGTRYAFGSYLNNAIHCGAWVRCLAALLPRDQVRPIDLVRVLKSLHDQVAYLEVVTNGHSGNWPIIGCQGMLKTTATLPVLRDTDRFADYAARTLGTQIAKQVLPDGVQDELTPHYHRVVVGCLLGAVPPLRSLGRDLDAATLATLRKMVRYVQQTTTPDGSKQTGFNDSDPGSPGNIAQQLAELGLSDFLSPPNTLGPEMFPYAGVAFLRQRQDRGDLYLAFDAGPYGRAHQHEDKLGFWLFAYGRNFIVDPGRHLYDSSARSYWGHLKSTAAHSTIRIDGLGQNSRGRHGSWIAEKPLDLGWRVTADEMRARGDYDLGYGPENKVAVVHRREIVFVRERFWVVFDAVDGAGEHAIDSRFQFAPGNLIAEGATARTDFADSNLLLTAAASKAFTDVHVEKGQEKPRGGWYSDSYGKIEPAPALSMSVKSALPWRAATLLYPYRGKMPPQVSITLDGAVAVIRAPDLGEVRVTCSLL